MYKSIGRLTVLTAAVLPIVTMATAALADDDKTYPGTMCRAIDATKPSGIRQTDGAMLNQGPVEQEWICPAVRSRMKENPEFVRITVQENGTDSVKCSFEARDKDGLNPLVAPISTKESQVVNQTVPTITLAVRYTVGAGDGDIFNFSDTMHHGYYFIRCIVPGTRDNKQSGVITYKVSEND